MPQTLHGTGGTRREQIRQLAVDIYSKGHATPLAGHYRLEASRQLSGNYVETSLHNLVGQHIIVCGYSKVGGTDVCGG
jgi:hypothetical protein